MSELLLVHGSCHGAWCWDHLIPELASLGMSTRAIDLPSHGQDQTPPDEVTLDSYADAILDALDRPAMVLGHSAGGYAITAAAQKAPEQITGLIYLCAYVPIPGKTMIEMRKMAPTQPLLDAVRVAPDRVTYDFDPALVPEKFYQDVPRDIVNWALAHVCPEPIKPQDTALPNTSNAEALPRHYIRCLQDGAIPPAFQRTMTDNWHGGRVFDMDTSHSPFLSAPAALAQIIKNGLVASEVVF